MSNPPARRQPNRKRVGVCYIQAVRGQRACDKRERAGPVAHAYAHAPLAFRGAGYLDRRALPRIEPIHHAPDYADGLRFQLLERARPLRAQSVQPRLQSLVIRNRRNHHPASSLPTIVPHKFTLRVSEFLCGTRPGLVGAQNPDVVSALNSHSGESRNPVRRATANGDSRNQRLPIWDRLSSAPLHRIPLCAFAPLR